MVLYAVRQAALAVCIILPVFAIAAMCLRFYARKARKLPLLADDWSALVALILTVVACILTFYGIFAKGIGLGPKELPPQQAVQAYKVFYGIMLLLYLTFGVIKVSFILFYERLFPNPRFRLVCNIMIAAITGWTISQFIIEALNSWNLPEFWNEQLLDYGAFNISMAVLDLVFDISILLLPLPIVFKLQMDNKRKYSLIAIFWLGSICIIASSLRIYYTYEFLEMGPQTSESRFTHVSSSNGLWLAVEANISIIAACLPTLGGFLHSKLEARSTNAGSKNIDMRFRSRSLNGKIYGKDTPWVSADAADHRSWIPLSDVEIHANKVRDGDGGALACGKGILVEKTFANERM